MRRLSTVNSIETMKIASQIIILLTTVIAGSRALTMSQEIYGVRHSSWSRPEWNWGSAVGTAHDCAAICRNQYQTRQKRRELVRNLLEPAEAPEARIPKNFEEVKLILALAWQRGRWDGSDGGQGGYQDVLQRLAKGRRYEVTLEEEGSRYLVEDMQKRFRLLHPTAEAQREMDSLLLNPDSEIDVERRRCSGLVLEAMGFVEHGL